MANYGQPKRFWAKMLPKSNKSGGVAKITTKVAINLTVCILATIGLSTILPIAFNKSVVVLIKVIETQFHGIMHRTIVIGALTV